MYSHFESRFNLTWRAICRDRSRLCSHAALLCSARLHCYESIGPMLHARLPSLRLQVLPLRAETRCWLTMLSMTTEHRRSSRPRRRRLHRADPDQLQGSDTVPSAPSVDELSVRAAV